jgi:hypothetical protein
MNPSQMKHQATLQQRIYRDVTGWSCDCDLGGAVLTTSVTPMNGGLKNHGWEKSNATRGTEAIDMLLQVRSIRMNPPGAQSEKEATTPGKERGMADRATFQTMKP